MGIAVVFVTVNKCLVYLFGWFLHTHFAARQKTAGTKNTKVVVVAADFDT